MSKSPTDAEKRAARMAAFSAKVKDEEDTGVAVRSFNEAKTGSAGSKEYDPKTGQVRSGSAGGPAPAPKAHVKTISDDELFADIDAAVEAEEKKGGRSVTIPNTPPPAPVEDKPKPASPQFSSKRLAAMANFAIEKPDVPKAETPAKDAAAKLSDMGEVEVSKAIVGKARPIDVVEGSFDVVAKKAASPKSLGLAEDDVPEVHAPKSHMPKTAGSDEAFSLKSDKPEAAKPIGHGKNIMGEFEVKLDATESKPLPKIKNAAEASFDVKVDREERDELDIVAPADEEFAVKSDASSSELASASGDKVKEVLGHTPVELPRKASKAAPAPMAKHQAETRRDTHSKTPAPLPNFGEAKADVKRDAGHSGMPKMHNPSEGGYSVKRDAEPKQLPRMQNASDRESFVARLAREQGDMPRLANPTDAEDIHARQDKETREAPRIRSPAETLKPEVKHDRHTATGGGKIRNPSEAEHVETRQDKESRGGHGRIHNVADTAPSVKQDRESREAPRLRSPADAPVEARLDRESRGGLGRIHNAADTAPSVKLDRESRETPRLRNPTEAGTFETRQDAEAKALPKLRNVTDESIEARRDAEAKALPKLRNVTDGASIEARRDAEAKALPKLRNVTDGASIEARRDAEAKALPKLRNVTDTEPIEARRDAEAKALPKLRNVTDTEPIEARRDAEAKALPKLRNATDAANIHARRDAEAKALPRMRSAADADAYETRRDAEAKALPKMRSAADDEAYDTKLAWQQKAIKGIQSPADVAELDTKMDREHREKVDAHNPGQSDFEVKMEHESVWTTQPKRDISEEQREGKGRGAKKN